MYLPIGAGLFKARLFKARLVPGKLSSNGVERKKPQRLGSVGESHYTGTAAETAALLKQVSTLRCMAVARDPT